MATDATVVLENYTYFECPRWHDDRVWASDFYTHQVISARADGSDVRVEAEVPQQPSGLGWLPDGQLLIVSMRDTPSSDAGTTGNSWSTPTCHTS